MITVYIGRHGETDLNSEDKLRGWKDVPLNKDGIREAQDMAKKMQSIPIDRIYCSDLDRADHTAQIVAIKHHLKPIPRMWFRPINFGDWNGKPLSEIHDKMDQLLEEWKTDPTKEAPGGESFEDFQDRNLGGLQAVIQSATSSERIMIVAHLRNALLFWALSQTGRPLQGEDLTLMDNEHFHQESGEVAEYQFDGLWKFKGKL